MKYRILLLFGVLLVIANACSIPGSEVQTTKIPEITTPELATITPEVISKKGQYENDVYSFTIPDGWGLTLSSGEHYSLLRLAE